MNPRTTTALLITSTLFLGACTAEEAEAHAAELKAETLETLDAIEDFGHARREELADALRDGVESLEEQLGELRAAAAEKVEAGEEGAEDALDALEARRQELAHELEDLKDASAEEWEEIRDRTVAAYEDLRESVTSTLEDRDD